MAVEDNNIAINMYEVITTAMKNSKSNKDEVAPRQRMRSSSANEASKPISVLQRRHTGQKLHGFSPLGKLIFYRFIRHIIFARTWVTNHFRLFCIADLSKCDSHVCSWVHISHYMFIVGPFIEESLRFVLLVWTVTCVLKSPFLGYPLKSKLKVLSVTLFLYTRP